MCIHFDGVSCDPALPKRLAEPTILITGRMHLCERRLAAAYLPSLGNPLLTDAPSPTLSSPTRRQRPIEPSNPIHILPILSLSGLTNPVIPLVPGHLRILRRAEILEAHDARHFGFAVFILGNLLRRWWARCSRVPRRGGGRAGIVGLARWRRTAVAVGAVVVPPAAGGWTTATACWNARRRAVSALVVALVTAGW